jgi:hypothetical protein
MNTGTIYIPKLQDWVDYYGTPSVEVHPIIESVQKRVDCNTHQPAITHTSTPLVQDSPVVKSTNISTGEVEMSTGIQVVSPVQTAVNQAMASKRRRSSKGKKKGRRRKSTQRKKKIKVKGKRRKKTKIKKKKRKSKSQRDIFNY